MSENLPALNTEQLPAIVNNGLQTISIDDIGALDSAEVAPIDLMSDYWSPENFGEKKRVLFHSIENTPVVDQVSGEVLDLPCAYFLAQENGNVKRIRNGSKRLVGALQSFNLAPNTPLEITYLGKKANKTNPFKSDNWMVKPLQVNVTPKQ